MVIGLHNAKKGMERELAVENALDVVKRDILQEIAQTQERKAITHQGLTLNQSLLLLPPRSQKEGIERLQKVLQSQGLPISQARANQVEVKANDLALNINELFK